MKQSDDSGEKGDIEFGGDGNTTGGEYVYDPVGYKPMNPTQQMLTAIQMAEITFQGEDEFRQKVAVEIQHNIKRELSHVIKLCQDASVQGSAWFAYNHTQWQKWIKSGPEISRGASESLIKRKTKIREYMILEALETRLEKEGYTCYITRPYRADEGDKDYLYIQWSRPRPPQSCWTNFMFFIRLGIFITFVAIFLFAFATLLSFTIWLMVTRWEKLELWE